MRQGRRRLRAATCAVVLSCLLLMGVTGRTQPAGERVVVMIVPADQVEALEPVISAVESHFSDRDVTLVFREAPQLAPGLEDQVAIAEQVAREQGAIAVFWCDLVADDHLFLYLAGNDTRRILVRNLDQDDAEGLPEAVAVIVHASVSEMLKGGKIGIEPPAAAAPTAPAVVAEPPASPGDEQERHFLGIELGYELLVHSTDHLAVHGLHLGLTGRPHENLAILAGYTVAGPIEARGTAAALRVDRHPVHLGLRVSFAAGRARLGFEGLLTVDIVTFENYDLAPGMAPAEDSTDVAVGGAFGAVLVVPFADRLAAFLSVGVEVPFNRYRYVAISGIGEETLVDQWPAMPRMVVGVSAFLL